MLIAMLTAGFTGRAVLSNIRQGFVKPAIDFRSVDRTVHHSGMPWWELTWRTGPDAGARVVVAPGRHVVGRAPQAHVRCDDPAIEPFHALLLLADDRWEVMQLAGRVPLRVDPDGVALGASVLGVERVGPPPSPTASALPPVLVVVRPPRGAPPPAPVAPEPPPPPVEPVVSPPVGGAVVPAALAAMVGVVAAIVLGQPLMAALAVVGLVATGATAAVQRVGQWRHRRRSSVAHAEAQRRWRVAVDRYLDEWAHHQRRLHGSLATRLAAAETMNSDLWSRRSSHDDAFMVPVGEATLPSQLPSLPAVAVAVDGLPVTVNLAPGAVVVVRGTHAASVVRAMVVSLACQSGPADWHLAVVSGDPAPWRWLAGLPHLAETEHSGEVALADDAALAAVHSGGPLGQVQPDVAMHQVVITDRPDLLTVRTGPLRRLLDARRPPAIVVVAQSDHPLPAVCTHLIDTRHDGTARSVADTRHPHDAVLLRTAGLSQSAAARAVARLARLRDPEDLRSGDAGLAEHVSFVELQRSIGIDPLDARSVANGWSQLPVDPAPVLVLGSGADGRIDLDLVADGPHGLVAGTTGSGKSELLRSVVMGLACRHPPDLLTFVLVDYKGGAAFDACTALPHVVGVVTDLDAGLADRALRGLRAELVRREALVRAIGAGDLADARRQTAAPVAPRLVVVVDEFAALAAEHPEVLHALVGIAQRGRSLGVHLLLATQRPSGVVSDDIRANTQLRLALRLHDRSDSLDVVGDTAAALLSRRHPGRAVLRLGSDATVVFQTAHLGDDLPAVVAAVASAAADRPVAAAPWCAPLPTALDDAALPMWLEPSPSPGAVGVIDLPEAQGRAALEWRREQGDLLVVGAPGSGVTSTLHTVVRRALELDRALSVAVFDGGGDPQWDDLVDHPACAGVVRLHERERCWRGLRWAALHEHGPHGSLLVVIDAFDRWRRDLDSLDRLDELEWLESVVGAPAPGVGLAVGITAGTVAPAVLLARASARWVMHCNDPADAVMLGVPPGREVPRVPGRLVDVATGELAHVVAPTALRARSGHRASHRIGELPAQADVVSLPASGWVDGSWWLPLGLDAVSLEPAVLEVPEGDHLLVAGPGRSGRTTSLRRLAQAFRATDPAACVVVVAPRRRAASGVTVDELVADALHLVDVALAERRRCLLVVDDAERVPDPGGALERLVLGHHQGLVVAAAGRADALRGTYGHWTGAVRRARAGLLAASCHEHDGDLLGVTMPRRLPVRVRPGLVHAVLAGERRLVLVATDGCHDLDDLAGGGGAGGTGTRAFRRRV